LGVNSNRGGVQILIASLHFQYLLHHKGRSPSFHVFIGKYYSVGFFHRLNDTIIIDRSDGPQVDHLRLDATLRAAVADLEGTVRRADSAVRERLALYEASWQSARAFTEQVVPLQQRVLEESLLRYNGMLIGVFELLADARERVGSVIQSIEAQRDFWLADAALQATVLGHPLAAPAIETRAGHANMTLEQLIIAMSGSFDVILDDGCRRRTVTLNRSYLGLYIPGMIWREIENFSSGSVCVVLASDFYDENDYYRDYLEYQAAAGRKGG